MTHLLNKLLRGLWVVSWITRTVWCFHRGRWFCFRNAPDVIVRLFALSSTHKGHDPELDDLCDAAKTEWRLRVSIRKPGGVNP